MESEGCTIGVDLGGTKLDVGLVDKSGKVVDRILIKTKAKEGPKAVVDDIVASSRELITRNQIQRIISVGVGIAGQIEKETGVVRFAPNLNWHNFPLQDELGAILKLPVSVTNDVRAATIGEWLYGVGRGCQDLLCLFIGTGIGGGIVSGGRVLVGSSNIAGEVGHMTLQLNGPKCSCGNLGCFEALASGSAIARMAKEAAATNPKAASLLLTLADKDGDQLAAKHVFQAMRKGDLLAKSIVDHVASALVAGVSGLINAINPEKVILGGGVIKGYPEFVEIISKGVAKVALKAATDSLSIVSGTLEGDAGVIGAAVFSSGAHHHKGASE